MAADPHLEGLEVYLVGGAVRDRLLGKPVSERDWVVVGATPEALEARGFRPVGRDFPVFLHPETHEEYALARTERKTGRGYHGFHFHATPEVSLEADLARRDLTVNAMAEAADGSLVDPFGGRDDLAARRLRHVTDAFREDPVRILRLARFSARLARYGFVPATDTLDLCRAMVADGEVDHLVPERVWQELAKALEEAQPSAFFRVLRDCGALARVIPEVDALFGCQRTNAAGATVDAGEHGLASLDTAAAADAAKRIRLGLAWQFLGTGTDGTDPEPTVRDLAERLRVPNDERAMITLCARHLPAIHNVETASADAVVALLEAADAYRQPERFHALTRAAELDAQASGAIAADSGYPPRHTLDRCLEATAAITGGPFAREGLRGPAIRERVHAERVATIAALRDTAPNAG